MKFLRILQRQEREGGTVRTSRRLAVTRTRDWAPGPTYI